MKAALVVAVALALGGCGPDAPAVDAAIGLDARRDAAVIDGAMIDGAMIDGAMIDGAMIDGATIDGATIDGATIDGAVADASPIDGTMIDGATIDGAVADASPIDAGCPARTFTLDGVLDPDVTVLGGGARVRLALAYAPDGRLYVATDDAGEGSDHFLLVSATPPAGATLDAPFAKAGTVAAGSGPLVFLADENDNDFEGWFRREIAGGDTLLTGPAYGAATGVNGGVLEGTIDLAAAFGAAPTTVYVAAVLYGNADGGALVAGAQTPAGNGDGVVDPAEYHAFALPCR